MVRLIAILSTVFLFFTLSYAKEVETGKFLGGKNTTMPSWFSSSFLDLNEDIEELSLDNKTLIIFVHQDNCPYCNLFVTKNLSNEKIKQKIVENFGIVDINMFGSRELSDVDGEDYTEKEYAIKHKIQFTPTLIFFDKEGNQVLRLNGYANIKNLNSALDFVKNKRYKLMSYKDYLVEHDKRTKLIAEPDLFKDSKNFMRAEGSKKMAIFFESGVCSECEPLHNKLLKDKITRGLLKQIDVYQVDMHSSKSIVTPQKVITKVKDWTNKLNITHTPTVIFFDEKGEEIIRIESLFKNFHFQTIVDYAVSGAYKEEKEFQRYLTKRANAIRAKGIDVNIWE